MFSIPFAVLQFVHLFFIYFPVSLLDLLLLLGEYVLLPAKMLTQGYQGLCVDLFHAESNSCLELSNDELVTYFLMKMEIYLI